MRVEVLDSKGRRIRVRPAGEEDLWALMVVLRPGDVVEGRTFRDVSVRGGRKERRPIWVRLRVGGVEFQPFTGRLRVHGVIVDGPEEYGVKGRHHSMTIAPGQEVVLERESGWPRGALERLRRSGPGGRAVVAAVDYDEYAVALLSAHGYRVVAEGYSGLPGKDSPDREEALRRYVERVARLVVDAASREGVGVVVVVGPGDLKREVARRVTAAMKDVRVFVDDASMGGRAGVEEALRRPRVAEALREYSVVEAEAVIDEAMRLLARHPQMVATSLKAVREAAELGAVDKLAMVYDLLYSIDDEEREEAWRLLEAAERTRAKIVLVPQDSPAGERLRHLGGVIAVLRYPLS